MSEQQQREDAAADQGWRRAPVFPLTPKADDCDEQVQAARAELEDSSVEDPDIEFVRTLLVGFRNRHKGVG